MPVFWSSESINLNIFFFLSFDVGLSVTTTKEGLFDEALINPQEPSWKENLIPLTVNGVRFSFEDGSWGLIRASSNKPSLVIVTESPTSDERKKKIFNFIDDLLQKTGKIGEYDQKI